MHARVHDGTWPTAPGWSVPWSPRDLLQLLIWASFRLLSTPRNSLFLPPIHVCVPPSRPSPAIRVPENPQVPGPVQPSALTTCKPLWCSLSLPSTGGVGVCVLLPEAECESSLSELLVHLLRSLPVSGPTPPRCLCRHHNYQLRVGSTQSPPVTTLGPGATLPRQRRRTTGAWLWGSLVSPCLPSSRTSGQNACKQSHQLGTTPAARGHRHRKVGCQEPTSLTAVSPHTGEQAVDAGSAVPASPAYRSRLCGSRPARRVARLAGKKGLSARAPPASG